MRLRGASKRDYDIISDMYSRSDYNFNASHLQRLVVVEDENGIIAMGSLQTILEGTFLTNNSRSRRERVLALRLLIKQIDAELQNTKYDHVNVFCTNDSILKVLKRKFNFVRTKALEVLVRTKNGSNGSISST